LDEFYSWILGQGGGYLFYYHYYTYCDYYTYFSICDYYTYFDLRLFSILDLRVASCELRVASCELRVASCELRVAIFDFRFTIFDFRKLTETTRMADRIGREMSSVLFFQFFIFDFRFSKVSKIHIKITLKKFRNSGRHVAENVDGSGRHAERTGRDEQRALLSGSPFAVPLVHGRVFSPLVCAHAPKIQDSLRIFSSPRILSLLLLLLLGRNGERKGGVSVSPRFAVPLVFTLGLLLCTKI
jgi:hypothetical protein